jgi:hypothetical protein
VNDEPLGIGKAERQQALIETIVAGQQPEQSSARAQLERLLSREALARVDEQVLALVLPEAPEPEPESFLDGLFAAKEAQRRRLHDALVGRPMSEAATSSAPATFDGGARESPPPPPPSHEETLLQILRDRQADAGASF